MNPWNEEPEGRPQVQFAYPPLTPVVKRIIVATVVAFFGLFLMGFGGGVIREHVVDWLAVDPKVWRSWFPLVPVWQLVTYGFVHDMSGLGHLFFNMLTLYFFGGMLESSLGGRRFGLFYFSALAVAALTHVMVTPLLGWGLPAIGASGACLAVLIASAAMRPNAVVYLLVFPVKLKYVAGALVVVDVFQVLVQLQGGPSDGTAIYVHLGGALYGFLAVRLRWIYSDPVATFERKRAVASAERLVSDEARMDQLLARIKRDGLGALSSAEREFLKRQSERGR